VFQFSFLIKFGDCAPVHQLEELKTKKLTLVFTQKKQMIYNFQNLNLLIFHDLLGYCHMRSEVIQIVAWDN
jgi:hypothetical protein